MASSKTGSVNVDTNGAMNKLDDMADILKSKLKENQIGKNTTGIHKEVFKFEEQGANQTAKKAQKVAKAVMDANEAITEIRSNLKDFSKEHYSLSISELLKIKDDDSYTEDAKEMAENYAKSIEEETKKALGKSKKDIGRSLKESFVNLGSTSTDSDRKNFISNYITAVSNGIIEGIGGTENRRKMEKEFSKLLDSDNISSEIKGFAESFRKEMQNALMLSDNQFNDRKSHFLSNNQKNYKPKYEEKFSNGNTVANYFRTAEDALEQFNKAASKQNNKHEILEWGSAFVLLGGNINEVDEDIRKLYEDARKNDNNKIFEKMEAGFDQLRQKVEAGFSIEKIVGDLEKVAVKIPWGQFDKDGIYSSLMDTKVIKDRMKELKKDFEEGISSSSLDKMTEKIFNKYVEKFDELEIYFAEMEKEIPKKYKDALNKMFDAMKDDTINYELQDAIGNDSLYQKANEEAHKKFHAAYKAQQDLKKEQSKVTTAPLQSDVDQIGEENRAISTTEKLGNEFEKVGKKAEEAKEKVITLFRAFNSEHGFVGDKGITWLTDSIDNVLTYLDSALTNKDAVGALKIDPRKILSIDANGNTYEEIKYLGDGTDDLSKKMIDLDKRIIDLRSNWHSLSNEQREELEKLENEYELISSDTSNLYGTHNTDWIMDTAKNLGYVALQIKNIDDSFTGTTGELTTTFALLDRSLDNTFNDVYDKIVEYGDLVEKLNNRVFNSKDIYGDVSELAKKMKAFKSGDMSEYSRGDQTSMQRLFNERWVQEELLPKYDQNSATYWDDIAKDYQIHHQKIIEQIKINIKNIASELGSEQSSILKYEKDVFLNLIHGIFPDADEAGKHIEKYLNKIGESFTAFDAIKKIQEELKKNNPIATVLEYMQSNSIPNRDEYGKYFSELAMNAKDADEVIQLIIEHEKELSNIESEILSGTDKNGLSSVEQRINIIRKAMDSMDARQMSGKDIFTWIQENCDETEKDLFEVSEGFEKFQANLRGLTVNSGNLIDYTTTHDLDVLSLNELTKVEKEREMFMDKVEKIMPDGWAMQDSELRKFYYGLFEEIKSGAIDATGALKKFNEEKDRLDNESPISSDEGESAKKEAKGQEKLADAYDEVAESAEKAKNAKKETDEIPISSDNLINPKEIKDIETLNQEIEKTNAEIAKYFGMTNESGFDFWIDRLEALKKQKELLRQISQETPDTEKERKEQDKLQEEVKETEEKFEEAGKAVNNIDLTSLLSVLEQIRGEITSISKSLGSIDENSGVKNLLAQFEELSQKLNEINAKAGKGVVNLNVGGDDSGSKAMEIELKQRWRERVKEYQGYYESLLKKFGGNEQSLLMAIGGKEYGTSGAYRAIEEYSRSVVDTLDDEEKVERLTKLLNIVQKIAKASKEADRVTDLGQKTAVGKFYDFLSENGKLNSKFGFSTVAKRTENSAMRKQAEVNINGLIDNAEIKQDTADLKIVIEILEQIGALLLDIKNKDLFGDNLKEARETLDVIIGQFKELNNQKFDSLEKMFSDILGNFEKVYSMSKQAKLSSSTVGEEGNEFGKVAKLAKLAAEAKEEFNKANQVTRKGAEESTEAVDDEAEAFKDIAKGSADWKNIIQNLPDTNDIAWIKERTQNISDKNGNIVTSKFYDVGYMNGDTFSFDENGKDVTVKNYPIKKVYEDYIKYIKKITELKKKIDSGNFDEMTLIDLEKATENFNKTQEKLEDIRNHQLEIKSLEEEIKKYTNTSDEVIRDIEFNNSDSYRNIETAVRQAQKIQQERQNLLVKSDVGMLTEAEEARLNELNKINDEATEAIKKADRSTAKLRKLSDQLDQSREKANSNATENIVNDVTYKLQKQIEKARNLLDQEKIDPENRTIVENALNKADDILGKGIGADNIKEASQILESLKNSLIQVNKPYNDVIKSLEKIFELEKKLIDNKNDPKLISQLKIERENLAKNEEALDRAKEKGYGINHLDEEIEERRKANAEALDVLRKEKTDTDITKLYKNLETEMERVHKLKMKLISDGDNEKLITQLDKAKKKLKELQKELEEATRAGLNIPESDEYINNIRKANIKERKKSKDNYNYSQSNEYKSAEVAVDAAKKNIKERQELLYREKTGTITEEEQGRLKTLREESKAIKKILNDLNQEIECVKKLRDSWGKANREASVIAESDVVKKVTSDLSKQLGTASDLFDLGKFDDRAAEVAEHLDDARKILKNGINSSNLKEAQQFLSRIIDDIDRVKKEKDVSKILNDLINAYEKGFTISEKLSKDRKNKKLIFDLEELGKTIKKLESIIDHFKSDEVQLIDEKLYQEIKDKGDKFRTLAQEINKELGYEQTDKFQEAKAMKGEYSAKERERQKLLYKANKFGALSPEEEGKLKVLGGDIAIIDTTIKGLDDTKQCVIELREEFKKLKEEAKENALNDLTDEISTNMAKRVEEAQKLLDEGRVLPESREKLQNAVDQANAHLKAGIDEDNIKASNMALEGLINNLKEVQKVSDKASMSKLGKKVAVTIKENTGMTKELKGQFEALAQKIKAITDAGEENAEAVRNLGAEYESLMYKMELSGKTGLSFFDKFKSRAFQETLSQVATYFSFDDIRNYIGNGIQTIIELDDALVDLSKTAHMSQGQLDNFYHNASSTAIEMGVSTKEIIEQASAWSRLGYNTEEAATKMAKISSMFASISPGMDTEFAQEGLVSVMKSWDIDPDDVVSKISDKINILGNTFALTNQDIIEGAKRAGAALATTGSSFEDFASLFVGSQEILQNAEKVKCFALTYGNIGN